ncbi:MAG: cytochrome b/b6 domain-containing protein [Gammaproteobacteria bacterium]|nr:cytochrome b/b6 domain-containing protein [Gammaproteobacteria bacterium]
MAKSPPARRYSALQRHLHWWTAALVLSQYAFQDVLSDGFAVVGQGGSPNAWQFLVITAHVWIGALLVCLVCYRLYLKRKRPVPVAAGQTTPSVARLLGIFQFSLYLVVLLMAVTGAVHYYLGIESASLLHEWGKWIVAVMVSLHVLAALWHWKVRRDDVFQRMFKADSDRNPGADH